MRPVRLNPLRRRGCIRLMTYVVVFSAAVAVAQLAYPPVKGALIALWKRQLHRTTVSPTPLTTLMTSEHTAVAITTTSSLPSTAAPCTQDEYLDDSVCRPCHPHCLGCAGHGNEACVDCRYGKDGGRCVERCPKTRPYRGGASGKWCIARCPSELVPDADNKCGKKPVLSETLVPVNAAAAQHANGSKLGWHFDPTVSLDFPKVALTTYRSSESLKGQRLLLPLLPYGPNNQYRGFKESILAAMFLNRTLALPPFFNHYSVSLPGHMPASKRHLAERLIMAPQETFDIDTLADGMPLASWKQFEELCGGEVHVEYHCRSQHDITTERTYYFYRVTKLNAEHVKKIYVSDAVKDWFIMPARQLLESAFSSTHRCAVLAFPYKTLIMTPQHFAFLSKHLLRSVHTRQVASLVWQGLLQGHKYIAVHWRFNSEWGRQWCRQSSPFHYNVSLVPVNMRPECSVLAASNRRVLQVLKSIMGKYNIAYVYMAVMGQSKGLVDLLARNIKHLVLSSHIQAATELTTNYALSLVEQELCSGSEIFIGSTKSSWSQNVVDERFGAGKQEHFRNQWWHLIL